MQPAEIKGHIEFEHVGFAYPTRPDVKVKSSRKLTMLPCWRKCKSPSSESYDIDCQHSNDT